MQFLYYYFLFLLLSTYGALNNLSNDPLASILEYKMKKGRILYVFMFQFFKNFLETASSYSLLSHISYFDCFLITIFAKYKIIFNNDNQLIIIISAS